VITYGSLIVFLVATGILGKILRPGFIPEEDQGTFYVSVTAPSGATLERTKEVINAVQKEAHNLAGVESVSTLAGTNISRTEQALLMDSLDQFKILERQGSVSK
jgi:HAE1 family hydrophobic/amphiphilic exporter-1